MATGCGASRRVVLTQQHRRFWRKRNPQDFANVAAWTAALTDTEVDQMTEMLGRLYRHLMQEP